MLSENTISMDTYYYRDIEPDEYNASCIMAIFSCGTINAHGRYVGLGRSNNQGPLTKLKMKATIVVGATTVLRFEFERVRGQH